MIILLSPAKTMDSELPLPLDLNTQPIFQDDTAQIVNEVSALNLAELKALLGVSDKLAELNYQRFHTWSKAHTAENSRPAAFTFKGDAYVGLDAFSLTPDDITFAQDHLLILSGLYGALRPLDLMQPYRLEMGGAFVPSGAKSLLTFWKPRITAYLEAALKKDPKPWIMNLASTEYSSAVDFATLGVPVVSPRFLTNKNGQLKVISSFAKKARGMMTRWLIHQRCDSPERIVQFEEDGYRFAPEQSSDDELVFVR